MFSKSRINEPGPKAATNPGPGGPRNPQTGPGQEPAPGSFLRPVEPWDSAPAQVHQGEKKPAASLLGR